MTDLVSLLCSTTLEDALSKAPSGGAVEEGELLALVEASRAVLASSNADAIVPSSSILAACVIGIFPRCVTDGMNASGISGSSPLGSSRRDLAEAFLNDINASLKRLQTRHCVAVHAAKLKTSTTTPAASSSGDSETKKPVWNAHVVDVLVTSSAVSALLRVKSLVLSAAAASSSGGISAMRRLLPRLWAAPSCLHWVSGSSSIEQAESEFDSILATPIGSGTVATVAQAYLAQLQVGDERFGNAARPTATPFVLCSALPTMVSPPIEHMELKRSVVADLGAMLIFDNTDDAVSTALRTACKSKLLGEQADAALKLLSEVTGSAPSLETARRIEVLRRFLHTPPLVAQLAEKNKDTAVGLIMLRSACAASSAGGLAPTDFSSALLSMLELVEVSEPLCHIVKGLADADALLQSELEAFVLAAIRKIEVDQSRGDEMKVQRSSKLLALLLNNLLLRRRERIMSPEVEAALCELLVRTTKVRECAELYSTLCAVRKQHPVATS